MSIMSKSYIITIHAVFYVMQALKSASNIAWIWRITSSANVNVLLIKNRIVILVIY